MIIALSRLCEPWTPTTTMSLGGMLMIIKRLRFLPPKHTLRPRAGHLPGWPGESNQSHYDDECLPPPAPGLIKLIITTHTHTHRPCGPQSIPFGSIGPTMTCKLNSNFPFPLTRVERRPEYSRLRGCCQLIDLGVGECDRLIGGIYHHDHQSSRNSKRANTVDMVTNEVLLFKFDYCN